jgi:hypothetical protein
MGLVNLNHGSRILFRNTLDFPNARKEMISNGFAQGDPKVTGVLDVAVAAARPMLEHCMLDRSWR